jgi:hypothetical protein
MNKNLLYSLTCLGFSIIIGAAVYEHIAVVPQWSAAPPQSLAMFQGPYGLNPGPFWQSIHPVTLLLFLITLVVHWRSDRKQPLTVVLLSYMAILVVTAIYFVPELIQITTTPFASTVDAGLAKRAALWETLSLVRLGVLVILSLVLFNGLTKTNRRATAVKPGVQLAQPTPA